MKRLKYLWCFLFHKRGYPFEGYAQCMRCPVRIKVEWGNR